MENCHSIEEIENDYWGNAPENVSPVVKTSYELRKKNLQDLEIEDIRFLIKQDIGINILIPLALDILDRDILVEGDYYPGDLLMSVLNIEKNYWINNQNFKNRFREKLVDEIDVIKDADLSQDIKCNLDSAIKNFLENN